jgi:hypothetical protein
LAGFIYQQYQCFCPKCGIKIDLEHIDDDSEYVSNHFRKLHRTKVSSLGKHCSFLLCEVGTNINDIGGPVSTQQRSLWDDAEMPEFSAYKVRLETFEQWPVSNTHNQDAQQTFVTPEALAKHGFYFSGE